MERLSQLQECVNKLTELFFISVGALQRDAPLLEISKEIPVSFWSTDQVETNWKANQELAKSAARDIVQTAKLIDFLIDSLPGIEKTEDQQMLELRELEAENQKAEESLREAVAKGDLLLENLRDIMNEAMTEHENNII